MPRVLFDDFTVATLSDVDGRAPPTRPGSELWNERNAVVATIDATDDYATIPDSDESLAAINYALSPSIRHEVSCTVVVNDTTGGIYVGPSLWEDPNFGAGNLDSVYFRYDTTNGWYVLGWPGSTDTYSATNPNTTPVTMKLVRNGNTIEGYVDGTLRVSGSLTGGVFDGVSLYPGWTIGDFASGGNSPYIDDFEVREDVTMTASAGSIAVTGQDVTLTTSADITMPAAAGSIAVTGQDVTLTYLRVLSMVASGGSVAVTGQDVTLTTGASLTLVASPGSFTVSGKIVTLSVIGVYSFAFALDGTPIPIDIEGDGEQGLPVLGDGAMRSPAGHLHSLIHSGRPWAKTWPLSTPWGVRSTLLGYEAILKTPGRHTATGYLIGSSIAVYVTQWDREEFPGSLTYCRLTFTLEEADP